MSSFVMVLFGVFNIAIPVWTGFSIYNITGNNLLLAIVGAFITAGVGQSNPIVYLVTFPLFEYFYSGSLTGYSYVYIGLVLLNIAVVFGVAMLSRREF